MRCEPWFSMFHLSSLALLNLLFCEVLVRDQTGCLASIRFHASLILFGAIYAEIVSHFSYQWVYVGNPGWCLVSCFVVYCWTISFSTSKPLKSSHWWLRKFSVTVAACHDINVFCLFFLYRRSDLCTSEITRCVGYTIKSFHYYWDMAKLKGGRLTADACYIVWRYASDRTASKTYCARNTDFSYVLQDAERLGRISLTIRFKASSHNTRNV